MTRRSSDPANSSADFFRDVETIPDLLTRRARLTPGAVAFVHGGPPSWTTLSWETFDRRASVLAQAFAQGGMRPGARVGILAPTSVQWEIAQMAALRCGAIVVGLDPYYPDALLNELVQEIGVVVLIVQDETTRARLTQITQSRLERIVDIDWVASTGEASDAGALSPSYARAEAAAVITLTSGSTGRPQSVVYSHAQVVHAVRCIVEAYPVIGAGSRLVAWLPLANLFQRMIDLCAIATGATTHVVSDPRQVMQVLPTARPHVFIAVPLFCERVRAGIEARLTREPVVAGLVNRALIFAKEVRRTSIDRKPIPHARRLAFRVIDRLILARLRSAFGGQLRFIVTGSAPMPRPLLDWFFALGIPVLEAYGASENVVPIAANRLEDARAGTVGRAIGDNEVRIASNGEVQVRGFGVFDPALAENARRRGAITADGFLATGDLGSIDGDGFLTLRGRASEIFKNPQGRWISLPLLEAALREVPHVAHAAAIRLRDDRLGGVVTLRNDEPVAGQATPDRSQQSFRIRVEEALSQLPPANRAVAILVVKGTFSPASGEITTNLKLRRHAIASRYDTKLEALVAGRDAASSAVAFGFE